ncbi:MAG: 1-acyl-sn-glycerol-3-phosphate acyltransferase [Deltaproteobacteria bacterium]|nr:1-acyl-sn-glycerol-3-phosphate acyltransferase [Deltaproteobacteria bacterium]MCB9786245.1 1-acyl-sn-glycerol-3-phosphate acyltransferase [Deltaproteobacteria bacterium]
MSNEAGHRAAHPEPVADPSPGEARHRWRNPGQLWRTALATCVVAVYTVMAPFGYALFMAWLMLPTRDPNRRGRRVQAIVRRAFGLMHDVLRWCGLLEFDHRSLRGRFPDGPFVIVANHPTLPDSSALFASVTDLCAVVRADLYRKAWLRPLVEGARHLEGGRGNPLDAARVVEAGVARLNDGFRLMMFPEGSRSPPGDLRPFRRSAFEIACRARVPVVPVVIRCRPVWISKEVPLLRPPAQRPVLTLDVLDPVDPADFGYDSRGMLQAIERRLRGLALDQDASIAPPRADGR